MATMEPVMFSNFTISILRTVLVGHNKMPVEAHLCRQSNLRLKTGGLPPCAEFLRRTAYAFTGPGGPMGKLRRVAEKYAPRHRSTGFGTDSLPAPSQALGPVSG